MGRSAGCAGRAQAQASPVMKPRWTTTAGNRNQLRRCRVPTPQATTRAEQKKKRGRMDYSKILPPPNLPRRGRGCNVPGPSSSDNEAPAEELEGREGNRCGVGSGVQRRRRWRRGAREWRRRRPRRMEKGVAGLAMAAGGEGVRDSQERHVSFGGDNCGAE